MLFLNNLFQLLIHIIICIEPEIKEIKNLYYLKVN